MLHADLTRLDVSAIGGWAGKVAKLNDDELAQPKKFLGDGVKDLTKAGAKDIYLMFSAGDSDPIIVVPLEKVADGKKIAAALKTYFGYPTTDDTDVMHNAVVLTGKRRLNELKTLKPEERPEVAKAFAAVGDGVLHGVLFPGADLHKLVEKEVPNLPPELGGGSVKVLTGGLQWAAFRSGRAAEVPVFRCCASFWTKRLLTEALTHRSREGREIPRWARRTSHNYPEH